MENTKTKKALIMSVLSMVLCIAMLIGMTFAWFTDTASTGVNKIQAGNLNVELEMYDGSRYVNISKNPAPIFGSDTSTVAQNKNLDTLWEPGKTQIAYLAIKNEGNLALKYKVALNVTNPVDGKDLYKVMEYAIAPDAKGGMTAPAWTSGKSVGTGTQLVSDNDVSLAAGDTHYFALLVHMDEQAGNEYQGGKVDFDLSVLATQDTVESDSYNNQYDKNAQYPEVAYAKVSNQNELNDALTNPINAAGENTNKVAIDLNEGSYTLPSLEGKEVTIAGTKDTVISMKNEVNKASSVAFDGVTVEFANENYKGFQHTGKLTYKDCTITGKQFLYAEEVEFTNCKFVQDVADYNIWTYGAGAVLFKDCEFNCVGKAVLIYNEGALAKQNVEFQNCKFNASASATGKAAIEIDCSFTSYNVIIDQATADNVRGFDNGSKSNSTVWNVKQGNKPTTVTVADQIVYNN